MAIEGLAVELASGEAKRYLSWLRDLCRLNILGKGGRRNIWVKT